MKRLLFTLLALCSFSAQAQFNLIAEHGVTGYFTPCFPLFAVADGAETVTGITNATSNIRVSLMGDNEALWTDFTTSADLETISAIGTWVTPTANTDVRFGECESEGFYQLQFHNDHMVKSNATSLVVIITDNGGSIGDQWIHIDQNVATTADFTAASELAIVNKILLVESACDSGGTTSCVDANRTEADAFYWLGAYFCSTSGTNSGQCGRVTNFVPGTDTITFAPAFTQAITTNSYQLRRGLPDGVITSSILANNAITSSVLAGGAIVAGTFASNAIDSSVIADNAIGASELNTDAIGPDALSTAAGLTMFNGTADSGSSTTLVDAALTQPDFFWSNTNALVVHFSGGSEVRCIRGFTASSDTLLVSPAFTQAVATEDYVIIPALTCRNFP